MTNQQPTLDTDLDSGSTQPAATLEEIAQRVQMLEADLDITDDSVFNLRERVNSLSVRVAKLEGAGHLDSAFTGVKVTDDEAMNELELQIEEAHALVERLRKGSDDLSKLVEERQGAAEYWFDLYMEQHLIVQRLEPALEEAKERLATREHSMAEYARLIGENERLREQLDESPVDHGSWVRFDEVLDAIDDYPLDDVDSEALTADVKCLDRCVDGVLVDPVAPGASHPLLLGNPRGDSEEWADEWTGALEYLAGASGVELIRLAGDGDDAPAQGYERPGWLDQRGVPLAIGDTVRHVKDAEREPGVVTAMYPDAGEGDLVGVEWEGCDEELEYLSENLTRIAVVGG